MGALTQLASRRVQLEIEAHPALAGLPVSAVPLDNEKGMSSGWPEAHALANPTDSFSLQKERIHPLSANQPRHEFIFKGSFLFCCKPVLHEDSKARAFESRKI